MRSCSQGGAGEKPETVFFAGRRMEFISADNILSAESGLPDINVTINGIEGAYRGIFSVAGWSGVKA